MSKPKPVVTCPEILDLSGAGELYRLLREHADRCDPVHLDASKVTTVSSAGLQLLAAASAPGFAATLTVIKASDALRDAARDLGLADGLIRFGDAT